MYKLRDHGRRRIWLGFILLVIILIINFLLWRLGFSFAMVQKRALEARILIQQQYVLASFLYLLGFVLAIVAWIPITVIMTVAAGYFFGVAGGIAISLLGATLGCVASFLLSRYLLRALVMRKLERQLQVINRELKIYGAYYLLMLHALPVTPTPLLNALAGVTSIPVLTYAWTSFFGMLPAIVAYVVAGTKLHELRNLKDIMSFELIVILIFLFFLSLTPFIFRQLGMKLPKL